MGRTGRLVLGAGAAWAVALAASRALVVVDGWSMAPTLVPGERLLTVPVPRGPSALRARLVRPGAVVVIAPPPDTAASTARAATDEDATAPGRRPGVPQRLVIKRVRRVDGDGVLVEGDHPTRSTDGRTWGALPDGAVRAVVIARWPRVWRRP